MYKRNILLPAIATMLLAGGPLFAANSFAAAPEKKDIADVPPCPRMQDGPQMMDCLAFKGLNITPEQREKVQQLYTDSNKRVQPLRDQLFVRKQELKALQNSSTPDVNAVSQKAEEIVALKKQIRDERRTLGEQLDKELGLKPGTHSFMGEGFRHGQGPHHDPRQ